MEDKPQVIVVDARLGGLSAALRLIGLRLRPVVVERSKDVRERRKNLTQVSREHRIDPEPNYSFGEGEAGTHSDGKLHTRSKERGNVDKVSSIFCQHGASTTILVGAHPHIDTGRPSRVIEGMRHMIIECGGKAHLKTWMGALIIEKGGVEGIGTQTGKTFPGPVILATGHSTRDVYRWLTTNRVPIEAKGIVVGVRLEHPAGLIDQIQYHNRDGRGRYLLAAEYSFVTQAEGRGVYSFCICSGGFIAPAISGPERVVVNGMSPSNYGSWWSDSGMMAEIQPEDIMNDERLTTDDEAEGNHPEPAALRFQEEPECQCWLQRDRQQTVPARCTADFTRRELNYDLPESSYSPGLISSPLHFWMPGFITGRLSQGFQQFECSSRGFLTNEVIMIGVETRTSSPVRIVWDEDTLQHTTLRGLFSCGKGAGYTGGIVSAGIDRERCTETVT